MDVVFCVVVYIGFDLVNVVDCAVVVIDIVVLGRFADDLVVDLSVTDETVVVFETFGLFLRSRKRISKKDSLCAFVLAGWFVDNLDGLVDSV